ncbi:hypothetical protein GHT06_006822 [Daphnia sinensis]|uniref:PKD domain-containing protein n=1 Tax=Daphnia sinensis TaxID=1820382 RepID=A0AAD5KTG8_9CRUS|nr:hypothetical protein GHT06_006822 [Daphnia sinensis]
MRILLTALSVCLLAHIAFSQSCPPRPAAALKLVNNDICIGHPISVQNVSNANGNDLYYIWDWGDGSKLDTMQSTASPVHVYQRPQSDMCGQPNGGYVYKIKLTAQNKNDACLSHSSTSDAYAYFSPIADFIAPREVCIDDPEVAFANTTCPLNTPGTQVYWNFGDPASGAEDSSRQVHPRHKFTAIVREAPIIGADYTIPSTTICAPYELTVKNTSKDNITNAWSVMPETGWEFAQGTDATSENPVIRFTEAGEYTVMLQTNTMCGTRDWTDVKDTLCNTTETYKMKAAPAGGIWTGTAIDADGVFNPSVAGVGSHKITYTVTFGACSDTKDTIIRVFGAVVSAGVAQAACSNEGATIRLTGASPVGGWWTGVGVTDTVNGIFNPTQAGEEPASKCISQATKEVTVNTPPIAVMDSLPAFCVKTDKTFSHSSTGAVGYTWLFGDGDSSNVEKPTHAYKFGGQDTAAQVVLVSTPPVADYIQSIDEGCTPLSVDFTNKNIAAGTVYTWNFGKGRIATTNSPGTVVFDNTFDQDTVYKVILTAETPGCAVSVDTSNVTVFTKPKANFAVDYGSGCSPMTVKFSNASTGSPRTYIWNFGNGITSNEEKPAPQVYYTDTLPTTYTIHFTATNTCGNDTMERKVTVIPSTVKSFFGIDRDNGCAPLTINVSSAASYGAKVYFDLGDGIISNDADFTHTFTKPGTYKVVQTAFSGGCGQDTSFKIVNVWATPSAKFDHAQFNACKDRRVQFTQSATENMNVWWVFGDGTESGQHNPLHDYGRSGVFPVKFMIEDIQHGCRSEDSSIVEVTSPIKFKIDSVRHSGCFGINTGAIVIQKGDVTGGLPTYQFSLNDSTFSDVNKSGIFSNLTGRERYVVYVRDRAGCVDTSSVYINGLPQLDLDAGRDREIELGDSTHTFVTTNAFIPIKLKWTPSGSVSCDTCESVYLKPIETTAYTIVGTGPQGCTEKTRLLVKVKMNKKVYLPNVFTPNGDGVNDFFFPNTARHIKQVNYMRVFNRWGEMVFEKKEFQPNEENSGWDGSHRGSLLVGDVYAYVVEVLLHNGLTEIYKGDVTLIR